MWIRTNDNRHVNIFLLQPSKVGPVALVDTFHTSGTETGGERRPLVLPAERDRGGREKMSGAPELKTATIFNHCLRNETATCKINGPALCEKFKLSSVVSLPVTWPLTHLTPPLLQGFKQKKRKKNVKKRKREREREEDGIKVWHVAVQSVRPSAAEINTSDGSLRLSAGWNINFL